MTGGVIVVSMEHKPLVTFENVSKRFGKNQVLKNLNLNIAPHKITFIIGRSGEGKSVTLKHIIGSLIPDSGTVTVFGENYVTSEKTNICKLRKRIGYLFQHGALFDSMTALDNVVFPLLDSYPKETKKNFAKAQLLLESLNVAHTAKHFPSELSVGEKKLVGLARAIALEPELLLYDEPTTSMDSFVSHLIDDTILDMQKKNPQLTTIVVSHDIQSVLNVADFIVFLHQGHVYLEGDKETFLRSQDEIVVQFLSGALEGPLKKT